MATSTSMGDRRDEGMVLVLTLLLTIVLAVIVLALATYAATALRTSGVTDGRNESNANASAGLDWTIERLAEKQLTPADCDGSDVGVPVAVLPQAGTIAVACTNVAEVNGNPAVHLVANATLPDGTARRIDAVVQVPAASHVANVVQWSADAPLNPAAVSVTTTTAAPAGTTTTAAPPGTTTTTTTAPPTTTTTTATTTTTTTVPPSDEVSCTFVLDGSVWGSGGNGTLRIANGTSSAITGWTVRITHDDYSLNLYNVGSSQKKGPVYEFTHKKNSNGYVAGGATSAVTGGQAQGDAPDSGRSFDCAVHKVDR